MLRVLIPSLTYLIGYLISRYTIMEIKGKQGLFLKLFTVFNVIIVLVSFYLSAFKGDFFLNIVSFFFSLLVFLLVLPSNLIIESRGLIFNGLIGLVLGYSYNNALFVLLTAIMYFFKSSYDYLSKQVLFNTIVELLVMIVFAFTALIVNNNILTIIGCGALVRLLKR